MKQELNIESGDWRTELEIQDEILNMGGKVGGTFVCAEMYEIRDKENL